MGQWLLSLRKSLDAGRTLMVNAKLVTIVLVWVESDRLLHTRNAFASGGVLEDPATGAATAALAGYLLARTAGADAPTALARAVVRSGRTASLYVNGYNTIARATYARIGFAEVGTFATVLLD